MAAKSTAGGKTPYAVFDIDGTIIRWQLYHAIIDQLISDGVMPSDDFAAAKQAKSDWKNTSDESSFKAYEKLLIATYEKALATITFRDYIMAAERAFDHYKDQTYVYTRDLIKNLKAQGYTLLAISGSQVEIVAMLATYYGFDDWAGSKYRFEYGKYNGTNSPLIGQAKTKALQALITKNNASTTGSLAIADSTSDIPILEMVERPIAFNPAPGLRDYAQSHDWPIIIEAKGLAYELSAQDGRYQLAN